MEYKPGDKVIILKKFRFYPQIARLIINGEVGEELTQILPDQVFEVWYTEEYGLLKENGLRIWLTPNHKNEPNCAFIISADRIYPASKAAILLYL